MRRLRCALAVAAFGCALLIAAAPAAARDDGLAQTPPMGFNTLELRVHAGTAFSCSVDETQIKEMADTMVADGMKAAGYEYVIIDDCWMSKTRDANGDLQPDPARFPNGMKAVADYVHSKGLKLGLYESAGLYTCAGPEYPGSYGHEVQDAKTFASWGVDYLKYDNCGAPAGTSSNQAQYQARYKAMGDALAASGRKILYALCEWGKFEPWVWGPEFAHMWRTTVDVKDTWPKITSIFHFTVPLGKYAGPGQWNDPDLLEVGNGGMTETEYRSQFGLWSFMAAPLIASNDLRKSSPATLEILTNRDMIAIDQDPLGKAATVLSHVGKQWTLVKELAGGEKAVLFFNEDTSPVTQSVSLDSLGIGDGRGSYEVKDLWSHESSEVSDQLTAFVEGHGTAAYRIAPVTRHRGPSIQEPHVVSTNSASDNYVEPGKSTTFTSTLVNDGTRSINHVVLNIKAPAGWKVQQVKGPQPAVPGGSSTTATWKLTVPVGASASKYSIEVTGSYQACHDNNEVASQRPIVVPQAAPTTTSWLSDLPLTLAEGTVVKDQAIVQVFTSSGLKPFYKPLTLAGTTYAKGIGTVSGSNLIYYLGGHCSKLTGTVGVDDNTFAYGQLSPSIPIRIFIDGQTVFDQRVTKGSPVPFEVNLSGAKVLELEGELEEVFNLSVDWANMQVTCS